MSSLVAGSAPCRRYILLAVCALLAVVGMHAIGVHVVADVSHGPVHAMARSMVDETTIVVPVALSDAMPDPVSRHDAAHSVALCTFLVLATFVSIGRRRSVVGIPGGPRTGLRRWVVRPDPPVPRLPSVFASA